MPLAAISPLGKWSIYVNSVRSAELHELGKLIKLVGMLSQTKVYLFWSNRD